MATTPPPGLLRDPHAPRHGAGYDSYEPYPTRHSMRLERQRARERHTTPPPPSPKKDVRQNNIGALSPPRTRSPRKFLRGKTPSASENTGFDLSDLSDSAPTSSFKNLRAAMPLPPGSTVLPTPAKTPSTNKKSYHELGTVARSLFPTASSSSARVKKAKKASGFSLDSFEECDGNNSSIEIFTDSRDRIPQVNDKTDNPFAKKSETIMPSAEPTAPKRRKLTSRSTPEIDPKEAVKRGDGMLYTFRGKKVFRKFDEKDEEKEESDDDGDLGLFANRPDLLDANIMLHTPRLTRSSIKGRVLFPTNETQSTERHLSPAPDDDEEAATDIDEHVDVVEDDSLIESAEDPAENTSKRSLRTRASGQSSEEKPTPTFAVVAETKKGKRGSPFDIWMRKKQSPVEASVPKKREAESSPLNAVPATKKTRSNQ
ncbi:hypothetical protein BGW36DRAFT_200661 [Talaromyces proteolyticus]|uniref:Uncharacterized protein n=1 Tax=Talaromyces proteolyticus TaxID=1131652 RepID=A0AAD4PZ32_9EURO|nr:uncharacterized protein BGW36DRAFT_200661 [Talaromyces proteolyticus]KAH8695352.1 hypothetical protein BGW36DRAFT_200661 [Talaromyces proteolyticus]